MADPKPKVSKGVQPRGVQLRTWLRDELTPRHALSSLNAALILYLLEMIIALSVVTLIFSGSLAPYLPQAISCVLIGNALLVATVTYGVHILRGGELSAAMLLPRRLSPRPQPPPCT
mgnify:CR=1 FL=1